MLQKEANEEYFKEQKEKKTKEAKTKEAKQARSSEKQKQNEKPTPSSVPAQAKASDGVNKRKFTGVRPSGKTPHKSKGKMHKISPYNEFV